MGEEDYCVVDVDAKNCFGSGDGMCPVGNDSFRLTATTKSTRRRLFVVLSVLGTVAIVAYASSGNYVGHAVAADRLNTNSRRRLSKVKKGPPEDGACEHDGEKVPCPEIGNSTDANANSEEEGAGKQEKAKVQEQQEGYTKISLRDGKKFKKLDQMKHDKSSFTQGLTYGNGKLFESTGLYGRSKVRQLDPETGAVIKSVDMDGIYFGEGMTYYGDNRLIQITWKKQKGFIYDADTLDVVSEFDFTTTKNEGWGITYDEYDRTFIVSDGSSYLHFWDEDAPGIDKEGRPKVQVMRQNGKPANELNELEFVDGKVIANVWYEDTLLVIDPKTGVCEKEYDFKSLWPKAERRHAGGDVLNGVSVSPEKGILYVTGKLWDKIYKIKLDGMDEEEASG